MAAGLVPGAGEGVVKRPEEVDQQDEAVELMGERIGGIISERGEIDGGLESERPLALDGICSVSTLSVTTKILISK